MPEQRRVVTAEVTKVFDADYQGRAVRDIHLKVNGKEQRYRCWDAQKVASVKAGTSYAFELTQSKKGAWSIAGLVETGLPEEGPETAGPAPRKDWQESYRQSKACIEAERGSIERQTALIQAVAFHPGGAYPQVEASYRKFLALLQGGMAQKGPNQEAPPPNEAPDMGKPLSPTPLEGIRRFKTYGEMFTAAQQELGVVRSEFLTILGVRDAAVITDLDEAFDRVKAQIQSRQHPSTEGQEGER